MRTSAETAVGRDLYESQQYNVKIGGVKHGETMITYKPGERGDLFDPNYTFDFAHCDTRLGSVNLENAWLHHKLRRK